jgi:hypothetical protein
MPWSIAEPFSSRNLQKVARRGWSILPTIFKTSPWRFGPETRTTPIPPLPGGVAMAAMISEVITYLRVNMILNPAVNRSFPF